VRRLNTDVPSGDRSEAAESRPVPNESLADGQEWLRNLLSKTSRHVCVLIDDTADRAPGDPKRPPFVVQLY